MIVKSEIEAVAAPGRHRRVHRKHSLEAKCTIVQQCLMAGASVAAVALAHGVNANLVRKWIGKYRAGDYGVVNTSVTLLPVKMSEASATPTLKSAAPIAKGHIELDLPAGRIRLHGRVDADTLRVVLASLVR